MLSRGIAKPKLALRLLIVLCGQRSSDGKNLQEVKPYEEDLDRHRSGCGFKHGEFDHQVVHAPEHRARIPRPGTKAGTETGAGA